MRVLARNACIRLTYLQYGRCSAARQPVGHQLHLPPRQCSVQCLCLLRHNSSDLRLSSINGSCTSCQAGTFNTGGLHYNFIDWESWNNTVRCRYHISEKLTAAGRRVNVLPRYEYRVGVSRGRVSAVDGRSQRARDHLRSVIFLIHIHTKILPNKGTTQILATFNR